MAKTVREPVRANRKEARRDEVLDVAAELFYRRGYAQCTLADIGNVLGMHKASLYYYVESKEDLLRKVILRASEQLRARAESLDATLPARDRFEAMVRNHCTVLLQHREAFGTLIEQRRQIDPAVLADLLDRERAYAKVVAGLLRDLEREGLTPRAPARLRLRMTLDMMGSVVRWHPDGAPVEPTVEHAWQRIAASLGLAP
jgi:AcrR family transcriptional regulator